MNYVEDKEASKQIHEILLLAKDGFSDSEICEKFNGKVTNLNTGDLEWSEEEIHKIRNGFNLTDDDASMTTNRKMLDKSIIETTEKVKKSASKLIDKNLIGNKTIDSGNQGQERGQQEEGSEKSNNPSYCTNCGNAVSKDAIACVSCGLPPSLENKYCHNCGVAVNEKQIVCIKCGVALSGHKNNKDEATGTAAKAVYILYLVGILLGYLPAIVGVIIAYVNIGGAPEWERSHYQFQIRTFWIGLLYIVVGGVLTVFVIGLFVLIFWLVWEIIRCAKGIKYLDKKEAVPNPKGWLF